MAAERTSIPKSRGRTAKQVTAPAGRLKGGAAAPRRILVPVDFSPLGRQAVDYAAMLARLCGSRLRLLHVVETFPVDAFIGSEEITELQGDAVQRAKAQLAELADELHRAAGGVAEVSVRVGRPHSAIVEEASEAGVDLIVLATRGLTGLKRAYLGSTAERVVRHAHCPVTVVR